MKNCSWGVLCILAMSLLLNVVLFGATTYLKTERRDLVFLLSIPSYNEIVQHFHKEPDEIFGTGDVVHGRGWKAPKHSVSNKVLVYTRKTGLKIYIFIDKNDRLEYVFLDYS